MHSLKLAQVLLNILNIEFLVQISFIPSNIYDKIFLKFKLFGLILTRDKLESK